MKHILAFLSLVMTVTYVNAQKKDMETASFDDIFSAYEKIQKSIEQNDTIEAYLEIERLTTRDVASFDDLRCEDDTIVPVDGHFIFDKQIFDRIADRICHNTAPESDDEIYPAPTEADSPESIRNSSAAKRTNRSKTCIVKAGKSSKYSFVASGQRDLGIITEPGGRVYVRVHAANRNGYSANFNDDTNARLGARRYRRSLNLPTDLKSTITIEVINKGKKDTRFVIISN